jgi:Ran GTPase-activating protein (RanGAP) involved in mRNA processing and transport
VRIIKIDSAKTVSRTFNSSISTPDSLKDLVLDTDAFELANFWYILSEAVRSDNAAEVVEMVSIFTEANDFCDSVTSLPMLRKSLVKGSMIQILHWSERTACGNLWGRGQIGVGSKPFSCWGCASEVRNDRYRFS